MGTSEQELIRQLLRIFEDKPDAQTNLTLLVDTIYMLSGLACSTFLISRKDGQVRWDYMKGRGLKKNPIAAHQPYPLITGQYQRQTQLGRVERLPESVLSTG